MNQPPTDHVPPISHLPSGLVVRAVAPDLHVQRRWARPKHFIYLAWWLPLAVWLGGRWTTAGFSTPLAIGTFVTASIGLRLLAVFVERTDVRITNGELVTQHGPLPTFGVEDLRVQVARVKALTIGQSGSVHQVLAILDDGVEVSAVRPLASSAQAAYLRDVLASAMSVEARGTSLEHSYDDRFRGAAVVLASGPLVVIAGIALFLWSTSSTAQGSLRMAAADGTTMTFAPDGCRAGSVRGFHGAELTSSTSPGVYVRIIRDPQRGSIVALERNGGPPEVFDSARCSRLALQVQQTDTNINHVWAMDGSADVMCEGLEGQVLFSTCH